MRALKEEIKESKEEPAFFEFEFISLCCEMRTVFVCFRFGNEKSVSN